MSKFVMIIFGASGDLTKRKLIPALYNLYKDNRLPEGFAVLGIGRTGYRYLYTDGNGTFCGFGRTCRRTYD